MISFDDLFGLLLTEERQLRKEKSPAAGLNQVTAHYMNSYGTSSRGRGRGRGRDNTQTGSFGNRWGHGQQQFSRQNFGTGILPTPPAYSSFSQQAPWKPLP